MKNLMQPGSGNVIKTHTTIFILTVTVPLVCWLLLALPVKHCLALAGVGLFILSGHTIAFFDEYMMYLKKQSTLAELDDASLKKMLHMGIAVDLLLAFYFYIAGV